MSTFIYKRPVKLKLKPPPRRQAVLDFIRSEIDAGRPFPSPTAIADHMCWASNTVADVLNGLAIDGHIRHIGREPGRRGRILWEIIP